MYRRLFMALLLTLAACSDNDDGSATTEAETSLLPATDTVSWPHRYAVYQITVRSFQDSDGNGMGDLNGLTQRLDHMQNLGIGTLLLDPIMPADATDGYRAVSDFVSIDPTLGSQADFAALKAAIQARDMKLVLTLPLNQTSRDHAWFQRALTSEADRDWYRFAATSGVCTDLPLEPLDPYTTHWTYDAGADAYYYHRFATTSPDLNLSNDTVWQAVTAAAEYWLALGADGLFVPAPYAWIEDDSQCDDIAASRTRLQDLYALVHQYSDRALFVQDASATGARHNDVLRPGAYLNNGQDLADAVVATDLLRNLQDLRDSQSDAEQFADYFNTLLARTPHSESRTLVFPSGHLDSLRLAGVLGNDPAPLTAVLRVLLSAPTLPWLFYGDELAMGPGLDTLVDWRSWAISTMSWDADELHGGFTTGEPYIGPAQNADTHYAAQQTRDAGSTYTLVQDLLALRYAHIALFQGSHDTAPVDEQPYLIAWQTTDGEKTLIALHNLSDETMALELGITNEMWQPGTHPTDLLSPDELQAQFVDGAVPYAVELAAFSSKILVAQ